MIQRLSVMSLTFARAIHVDLVRNVKIPAAPINAHAKETKLAIPTQLDVRNQSSVKLMTIVQNPQNVFMKMAFQSVATFALE